jgi:putative transposase
MLVIDTNGSVIRPWLTVMIDDYSRAVAGYLVFAGVPSALHTSLALRQAIWRKAHPLWGICGIPEILYVDHGSDFTSRHLEQVAANLRFQLVYSAIGRPQGRGKVERFFGTLNTELLPELPGHLNGMKPSSTPRLSLPELDAAIGQYIVEQYNVRLHKEIDASPNTAWAGDGWLPHMPDSIEELDLLLIMVAKSRKIHRDGIRFEGLRYLDPTLAAYVGESVTIRYDPRDISEIRVFYQDHFLCKAISTEHSGQTITLKDIQTARARHRRALYDYIHARRTQVTDFLPESTNSRVSSRPDLPTTPPPVQGLFAYYEDKP